MKKVFLLTLGACLIFLNACKDDDDVIATTGDLITDISGLADLGSDYVYEGWLIVDGSPVSTGIFTVDGSGTLSKTTFEVDLTDLDNAAKYVLTIEPSVDSDPSPSKVHILGGDFSNESASLSVGHGAALGTDFTSATGAYILATPTNGMNTDENSGVWWLDPAGGPGAGLDLPTLPEGWLYEGWAVIDGVPVSTGTFTSVSGVDASDIYSGSADGPPFPGEDFLMGAPAGVTFPTDLAGKTVVISVEPSPDNSAGPFLLKPLVGSVPGSATDHTLYNMDNNAAATNPTGIATISK